MSLWTVCSDLAGSSYVHLHGNKLLLNKDLLLGKTCKAICAHRSTTGLVVITLALDWGDVASNPTTKYTQSDLGPIQSRDLEAVLSCLCSLTISHSRRTTFTWVRILSTACSSTGNSCSFVSKAQKGRGQRLPDQQRSWAAPNLLPTFCQQALTRNSVKSFSQSNWHVIN